MLETLKKHQQLANLKKGVFSQQSLVYLGYVIGGGTLKICFMKVGDILKICFMKVGDILKCLFATNVTNVRSFIVLV
jgi:hypothetical protein